VIPLPQDKIDYSSYQKYYKQPSTPTKMLPLFSQTCDNIKYSGAIHNQAINILNDTRDFINGVTDPIVNITKFEAGIFAYSFMMCLEDEASIALSPAKCEEAQKISGKKHCLDVPNILNSISETAKNLFLELGTTKSSAGTPSVTKNLQANEDAAVASGGHLVVNGLTEDMFDSILQCVNSERSKALRFLNDLFTKNFLVKTSIINSINAKCNVSAFKKGDPTSWQEIYDLQTELTPGITDTFKDITEFLDDPLNKPSINDIKNRLGVGSVTSGPCADGFGTQPCLTNVERELLNEFSKPALSESELTALFSTPSYERKRAGILSFLFIDGTDTLKDIYKGTDITFFEDILDETNGAEKNIILPIHTKVYLDLKNKFGIHSGTELEISLDEIMNTIFPSKALFMYTTGLNSGKDMLMPLDYPFKPGLIQYSNSPPSSESLIIAKTLEGEFISLNPTLYAKITNDSIVDFYRKYTEKTIIELSPPDESDETPALNIYISTRLVSEASFGTIKDNITAYTIQANNGYYSHIIGNDNPITGLSPFYRAAIVEYIFKSHALRLAVVDFFNSNSEVKVSNTLWVSKIKRNVSFQTVSAVKDFTIPRNLSGRIYFKQIRKFFQLFIMKLNEINLDASINALSKKIEASSVFSDETQILNRIEAKVNQALSLNQVLNAKTFNFRE
jgi:hypothetical protein